MLFSMDESSYLEHGGKSSKCFEIVNAKAFCSHSWKWVQKDRKKDLHFLLVVVAMVVRSKEQERRDPNVNGLASFQELLS